MFLHFGLVIAISDSQEKSQSNFASNRPTNSESLSAFENDIKLYLIAVAVVAITVLLLRYKSLKQLNSSHFKKTDILNMSSSQVNKGPIDPNREFTLKQLLEYNGSDSSKPIYLGCCGKVYDVTSAAGFYGPGGGYGVFAGRDASRGLAKMEVNYESANVSDLSTGELETLKEWDEKFAHKYPVVGKIRDSSEPNSGFMNP